MAGRKLSDLTTTTSLSDDDLVYVVDVSAAAGSKSKGIAKSDLAALMGTTAAATEPVENEYADITALLADQGNQTTSFLQYVVDASDDPNIASGEAYYEKLATSTSTLADDYRLLSDTEVEIIRDSNSYRVFRIQAIQDEGTPLTSVGGGRISFEYNGANVTAILFNARYTDAIAEFYGKDVNVRFYNRTTRKYQTEAVASTAWTTVNTDYYRAEVTGTNIQIADLTVNDRVEFFIVEAAAGGGGGGSTITESTGTTITFTQDTFWNNKTPLTSGALTLDLTSAVLGASGWVWCDKYTPSISGENYEISSGSFSSTKMNLLQFTVVELDADPNPRLDLKIANITYLSVPNPSTVTESIAEQITLNNFGVINATSYSIYRNTVENEYANEAAMLADQGSQTTGLLNLLQDTGVYYEKTASSTADISDYTQITTTEKGSAAAVTTPAYNGTDTSYTNTGLTNSTDYLYFLSCSGNGYLDSVYGFATGTPAAGFTFTAQSPDNFIQLPLVSTGTYNFTIYIDGVAGNTITTWNDANTDIDLGDTSSHEIELRGTVTGWQYNNGGDRTYIYNVSNWGSLKLGIGDASINGFFNGCTNLTVTATDVLDINTTSMRYAFKGCDSLTSLPNMDLWDWTSVTDMNGTFNNTYNFNETSINNIDVSNVTTFFETFDNCDAMTQSLSNWNVSSGILFNEMFRNSSNANPDMSLWDVSNATTMISMLQGLTSWDGDLSGWDVTSMNDSQSLLLSSTLPLSISTSNMDAIVISFANQSVNTGIGLRIGNNTNISGTVADSGTTDGTTSSRLVDSTKNFFSTVQIGDGVYNSTDGTYALVTNIVSDTVLQLNNDIMISGEAYTIYNNAAAKAVCKLSSTYSWTITFGGFV